MTLVTPTSISVWTIATAALVAVAPAPRPYPIDGYEVSGIRRLVRLQRIVDGEVKDTRPIPGAMKSISDIRLSLLNATNPVHELPDPDPEFSRSVNAIFPGLDESYSIAVLDMTPGRQPRYAERKGTATYQPGSVGKLAVATAFFTEIAKLYPDSFEKRQELMRNRAVRAGIWAMTDSHTVPFYNPETGQFYKRTVREDDVFTLYEWLDHMMSVSNNGAASVVWREAVLMRVFGPRYPTLTEEQANEYFRSTPKAELSSIADAVVNEPLQNLGIDQSEWRLGTFFTRGAGSMIPGKGGSRGSVRGLMHYLIMLENGAVVDAKSSLEIKRLMYMTDRRIRYAASPALTNAAVYFKSGSLYSCQQEEGYTCAKYKGNKTNYMNSVAIVEHEDGTTYFVVLMSNVLRRNSASDHLELATKIDRLVRSS